MRPSICKADVLACIKNLNEQAEAYEQDGQDSDTALRNLQVAAHALSSSIEDPLQAALQIMSESTRSVAVRVAIEKKWFEGLADGLPKTATELSITTGTEQALLVRLMRVMTSAGIVAEVDVETYRANDKTRIFLIPGLRDGAKWWFDTLAEPIRRFPDYLAHFGYREPVDFAISGMVFAFGRSIWKLLEEQPARRAPFDSYMTAHRAALADWTSIYPVKERLAKGLNPADDESVLIVDIGGGWGQDLTNFHTNHSDLPGKLVLQDLPEGLPSGKTEADLKDKGIQLMPYDFFTPQPIQGAKVYSFRSVLHDWPDKECLKILRNTVSAMKKGYSKILINDIVIPAKDCAPWQGWLDVAVMIAASAKERTLKQWEELLDSVGLRIVEVFPLGDESLMEVELLI